MDTGKLKTKDLITIVLLSLVNMVIFSLGSFLYLTPVTILMMPVFYGLLQGIVFFMLGVKVRKKGALLIYCIVMGVVGFNIPYIIMHITAGLIAEAVMARTGYGDPVGLTISYVALQLLAAVGSTIYPYLIVLDSTLEGIEGEGDLGVNIAAAGEMISSWGVVVLIAAVLAAAFIGALLGRRITRKHLSAIEDGKE